MSNRVLTHLDACGPTLMSTNASPIASLRCSLMFSTVMSAPSISHRELTMNICLPTQLESANHLRVSERAYIAITNSTANSTLRTDHSALTSVLSDSRSGRRRMRLLHWSDRLYQYNFTVVYRPGQDNMVHDILSHAPIPPSADLPSAAPREVHHHSSNSFFECSDSSFIGTIFGPTSISTISNSFFDGSDSSSIGNIFGPSYPPQSQSQN